MITRKIAKWGNSLGIRLPQPIIQQFGWKEGEQIAITVKDQQIILSLARPRYSLRYSPEELLKEVRPDSQHPEADWGEAQREEAW